VFSQLAGVSVWAFLKLDVACPSCKGFDKQCETCDNKRVVCPTCQGARWVCHHRFETGWGRLHRCPTCTIPSTAAGPTGDERVYDLESEVEAIEKWLTEYVSTQPATSNQTSAPEGTETYQSISEDDEEYNF
jgi:hypothetical protein